MSDVVPGWNLDPNAGPIVDAVFSDMKAAYRHNENVVSNFDPAYGYPTAISVDPSRHVIDDEWSFGIASFTPI